MCDLATETPIGIDAVAKLFGVSRRTVENWFERGLEKRTIGRRVYTTREAIQRFSSSNDHAANTLVEQEEREADERADAAIATMKERGWIT